MNPTHILLIGATGPTGKNVLNFALEKNYQVTALVRDASRLKIQHHKLKIIIGDVLDSTSVEKAVSGNEAVISTLGVGNSLKSNDLIFNGVKNLVPAMQKAGAKRLIFLSAFGVGPTFPQSSFIQKLGFKIMLKDIYRDKINADAHIRQSNLDYTLVCPVKLTNGPLTKKYRAAEKFEMSGFPSISRADVAHFMVGQLTDDKFIRKTVILKH